MWISALSHICLSAKQRHLHEANIHRNHFFFIQPGRNDPMKGSHGCSHNIPLLKGLSKVYTGPLYPLNMWSDGISLCRLRCFTWDITVLIRWMRLFEEWYIHLCTFITFIFWRICSASCRWPLMISSSLKGCAHVTDVSDQVMQKYISLFNKVSEFWLTGGDTESQAECFLRSS